MAEMSLLDQIRCIEQLQNDLEKFCRDMIDCYTNFAEDIAFLREKGFSAELADRYKSSYYTPVFKIMEDIVGDVRMKHYPYLEEKKEQLKNIARTE
ncbi:MAG: hypothetical protein IJ998_08880 [Alistipes sp.]|nr:hypothetical protein [Alistipes sp.]